MTKYEGNGIRIQMEAVGSEAAADIDAGMSEEDRAALMERLDGLPDVTVTVNAVPYDERAVIEEELDVPRQSPN